MEEDNSEDEVPTAAEAVDADDDERASVADEAAEDVAEGAGDEEVVEKEDGAEDGDEVAEAVDRAVVKVELDEPLLLPKTLKDVVRVLTAADDDTEAADDCVSELVVAADDAALERADDETVAPAEEVSADELN